MVPSDLWPYLACVSARLGAVLDGELLGLYIAGSLAFDGYVPGRSDIDLRAISRGALSLDRKRRIVEEVRHESLACPARALDLVVYAERTVGGISAESGFELELASGATVPFRAAFDHAAMNGADRYVVDRALLAGHAVTLVGPEASVLVSDLPRELVLSALAESLGRHTAADRLEAGAVLDACRALRYAVEGRWSSKGDAGRWAQERRGDGEVIAEALKGEPLEAARARAFLECSSRELASFCAVRRLEV